MKLVFIILYLFISCKNNDVEICINKTLDQYNIQGKVLFYRNKNNKEVNNTKRYVFLNGKEMLEENNENFLLLNINEKDDVLVISLYGYESGRSLTCYYRNNKLIKKESEMVKETPSKPFYIYYEIMKRKYPNYMNWKLFPIPQDSLK
ncbi:hypothetical protein CMT42_13045 [Elizabethkingia anophelis]|uniref:hypothetical protein n=2 Tax=Elizabethkingia anophelis TaxID=1117645 RepID=UPI000467CE85|nr:hypothetical protein [Elizabethkingia anophelis]AQX90686.1 hypothetical protein AYC67_17445 [Elizabethkingia anophelis]AVF47854.1 hypothetical protein AL491_07065 [Elizabethkingia anophelis]AVF51846.1 hypothetical protein AL492_09475 [Elizabethkingia anophelis]EHM7981844.1 hypothetical protein [Elizabethkingia anophelis]EHZ9535296.1 hypothetical protein [Elizabethkingia anophelis]